MKKYILYLAFAGSIISLLNVESASSTSYIPNIPTRVKNDAKLLISATVAHYTAQSIIDLLNQGKDERSLFICILSVFTFSGAREVTNNHHQTITREPQKFLHFCGWFAACSLPKPAHIIRKWLYPDNNDKPTDKKDNNSDRPHTTFSVKVTKKSRRKLNNNK